MSEAYTPTTWIDHYEDPVTGEVFQTGTPVDAEHLNNLEQGVMNAHSKADAAVIAGTTHTANAAVHVTAAQKAAWDAKQDALPNIMQRSVAQAMTAQLTAGGSQAVGTAQVRNIRASTTDLAAGVSALPTGQLYIVYE